MENHVHTLPLVSTSKNENLNPKQGIKQIRVELAAKKSSKFNQYLRLVNISSFIKYKTANNMTHVLTSIDLQQIQIIFGLTPQNNETFHFSSQNQMRLPKNKSSINDYKIENTQSNQKPLITHHICQQSLKLLFRLNQIKFLLLSNMDALAYKTHKNQQNHTRIVYHKDKHLEMTFLGFQRSSGKNQHSFDQSLSRVQKFFLKNLNDIISILYDIVQMSQQQINHFQSILQKLMPVIYIMHHFMRKELSHHNINTPLHLFINNFSNKKSKTVEFFHQLFYVMKSYHIGHYNIHDDMLNMEKLTNMKNSSFHLMLQNQLYTNFMKNSEGIQSFISPQFLHIQTTIAQVKKIFGSKKYINKKNKKIQNRQIKNNVIMNKTAKLKLLRNNNDLKQNIDLLSYRKIIIKKDNKCGIKQSIGISSLSRQFKLTENVRYLHETYDSQEKSLKYDELSLLKQANKLLRKSGLFNLVGLWNLQFKNMIRNICQRWNFYRFTFEDQLFQFVRIHQLKLLRIDQSITNQKRWSEYIYSLIYPSIMSTLKQILDLLELSDIISVREQFYLKRLKKSRAQVEKKQKKLEQDQNFMKQVMKVCKVEKEQQKDKEFYNNILNYHNTEQKSTLLQEFHQKFGQNMSNCMSGVQDFPTKSIIMDRITEHIYASTRQKQDEEQLAFIQSNKQKIINQVELEKFPIYKCLGCSEFFFKKQNIYHPSIHIAPVKVLPSILKLKNFESQLKDWICGMLNSGGGIILFDCNTQGQRIYAEGEYLTEKKKDEIEQKITGILEWFKPSLEMKKHIAISFVPIKHNPYLSKNNKQLRLQRSNGGQIKRQYHRQSIKGFFVTRIRVKPMDPTDLFYWYQYQRHPSKNVYGKYCQKIVGGQLQQIKLTEMTKIMKKRIKEHYLSSTLSKTQKRLMKKQDFTYFDHSCGVIDRTSHTIDSQIKEVKSKDEKPNFQGTFKQVYSHTTRKITQKYPYMSLLISNRSDLQKIKSKLDENGVDSQIEIRFEKYRFTPARNTAIIYHHQDPKTLRNKITKDPKFFFFNGKSSLMIKITNYVRLDGKEAREVHENLKQYKQWLYLEFPEEKLVVYEDYDKKDFYLWTESKLSSLFMYFVLVHNNNKAYFGEPNEDRLLVVEERAQSSNMKI